MKIFNALILMIVLWFVACSVTTNQEVKRSADDTGNPLRRQERCTQDMVKCPDGSYVGRDENNGCQFKLCE